MLALTLLGLFFMILLPFYYIKALYELFTEVMLKKHARSERGCRKAVNERYKQANKEARRLGYSSVLEIVSLLKKDEKKGVKGFTKQKRDHLQRIANNRF